ncbi:DoxX family protein [Mycolicibacterium sp. 050158]|uniref:DoxX family protein n=1 Tax=Mycolicibacterium sp. 050158 TaxID=3090602 RepID=UPI00299D7C63|nr:DoxX family protein [Mycolicibacterium sp. 050158]MDX1892767.1 DoxX family protein [Mycolicibacterium sp. 050158]
MHIAALVLSLVLALAMLASGVMKLIRAPRIVALMAAVNVTPPQLTILGGLQVASTIGLIAGIWFPPLAIAAAIGLVLYFSGAIVAHVRAGDRAMQGAIFFLVLAVATLATLFLDA